MKYSKRSVFFQTLSVDAHRSHVSAHLSVATVEEQDIGPPSIRPKTRSANVPCIEWNPFCCVKRASTIRRLPLLIFHL
jgi:hypothetical protein